MKADFLRPLRTIALVLVSYIAAAICAAVLVLLLLDAAANMGEWLVGAIFIVLVAGFVPFVIAIGVLHRIRQTGWLAHTVAGLLVSLVAILLIGPGMLANPLSLAENWPMLVSGAAAGMIYWLVLRALDRMVPRPA